jgi:hypothetical protein
MMMMMMMKTMTTRGYCHDHLLLYSKRDATSSTCYKIEVFGLAFLLKNTGNININNSPWRRRVDVGIMPRVCVDGTFVISRIVLEKNFKRPFHETGDETMLTQLLHNKGS